MALSNFAFLQKNGVLYARTSSGDFSLVGANILTNQWANVCIVYSGAGASAYINGLLVATNSSAKINYNVGISSFSVGNNGITTTTEILNGQLGPIHVYQTALNSTQVLQNFNALKGRFGL